MDSRWNDADARAMVAHYADQDVNEDLALRVYTSRLLGQDPTLVLHGGGNTSVKTQVNDMVGEAQDVLCVKGSGWDLGDIEPAGLPAVRIDPLMKMLALDALSDEDMVNIQRTSLMDSSSPNPSVETLLHAFLPHKFIDHTHANAVLALSDQSKGDDLCRELYGDRFGYVPYIMPGFALAKKALEVFHQNTNVEGLVLLKHGIFTFGETAQDAYERMTTAVDQAEKRLAQAEERSFSQVHLPDEIADLTQVAPIIRGLTTVQSGEIEVPMFLDFRTNDEINSYIARDQAADVSGRGTVTPDHVIRTKPKPFVTPVPTTANIENYKNQTKTALAAYKTDYHAYFARNNERLGGIKTELDPMPRVVFVPGLGLFGLGNSPKAAAVAADLAETNISVITKAEAMGDYQVIPEADIFDIEYWSLEQAKLGKAAEKPLQRKIVLVTGGGSGIGAATARAFAAQGAAVVVLDLDLAAAERVAGEIGGLGLSCDVTNSEQVRGAFNQAIVRFGGLDIVVSNAGAAWQGKIGDVDDNLLRQSFELNFFAHQSVAQNAVRVMRAQGIGGCLLFNTSKQAVNPGADFGPYGLPKAATLFLMRQYALDHGADGIRSNAVNADRIRSGLLTDEMIAQRSGARGLSREDYMGGNLLGLEVLAEDVAQAFVDLAKAEKTTAAVITVDGGNIAAALR